MDDGRSWFVDSQRWKRLKKERLTLKIGKKFGGMGIFSYLCTVQWNEGLEKAPHFHI